MFSISLSLSVMNRKPDDQHTRTVTVTRLRKNTTKRHDAMGEAKYKKGRALRLDGLFHKFLAPCNKWRGGNGLWTFVPSNKEAVGNRFPDLSTDLLSPHWRHLHFRPYLHHTGLRLWMSCRHNQRGSDCESGSLFMRVHPKPRVTMLDLRQALFLVALFSLLWALPHTPSGRTYFGCMTALRKNMGTNNDFNCFYG